MHVNERNRNIDETKKKPVAILNANRVHTFLSFAMLYNVFLLQTLSIILHTECVHSLLSLIRTPTIVSSHSSAARFALA